MFSMAFGNLLIELLLVQKLFCDGTSSVEWAFSDHRAHILENAPPPMSFGGKNMKRRREKGGKYKRKGRKGRKGKEERK
jgi:hypothetical protein